MKAANCSGEPGCESALSLAKVALVSALASPSLMAALSLATTEAGVRGGASTPDQALRVSDGNPASVKVGTSGRLAQRCGVDIASARNLPSWISGSRTV